MLNIGLRVVILFHAPFAIVLPMFFSCDFYENIKLLLVILGEGSIFKSELLDGKIKGNCS